MDINLDKLANHHLDLQVKILYQAHHDFLKRHGLNKCHEVLDIGCGNGTFVAKLAEDYPQLNFVGIDKRAVCVESANQLKLINFKAFKVDMFAQNTTFDFSRFDGFLMRYFFLHVDHAQKILTVLKERAKNKSQIWVIDLDWSQISCHPYHETGEKLQTLVKEFCQKISPETMGGEKVSDLLAKFHFQNIQKEYQFLSIDNIGHEDFINYIRQEIICYSLMSGKKIDDTEILEVLSFIDHEIQSKKFELKYGMVLISAEI